MHEITKQEILFFLAVWTIGFLAAFFRAVRDNDFRDLWHCFSLGAVSGMVSFGVVAVFFVPDTDNSGRHWYWLGISALVGLLGKEQDTFAKFVLSKVFMISRTALTEKEKES